MARIAFFCLAIFCFLPKRHALRVSHPKGDSYSYFDEGYGRRISSLSSSSPSPSDLSAEELEKQSSDSHESPPSSSYEKILRDFASSFSSSDSGEGRGAERDHSNPSSSHRPRSADQSKMSTKLFAFNLQSSPKSNQEREKNRFGNLYREENDRGSDHHPGSFAQEVIPKLTEMIFNSKPLSMSEDETLLPRGHPRKMSHEQSEYGSVVRYRSEPEPSSRYGQEFKNYHESPPSYQTKELSGSYSNHPRHSHQHQENEPYKSTSTYDSYLPNSYSNYGTPFSHETKDEDHHHESHQSNQHHHLPYTPRKMQSPPPPTESYMTLSFEPSSSKGSKSSYGDSRYHSPHYSSHQNSNPIGTPSPYYHHHLQYSTEPSKMYNQEESPQRIYNYREKPSLPSSEGASYGKNAPVAEVMSYYRTFSSSPATEQQMEYGHKPEPANSNHQRELSSPIGHLYASEPIGKPKVSQQTLDGETKYDWKQSVQRYAKEFGFEVPPVASRVGEPSPVQEEEVQTINGPAPIATPTSPDEQRFFHNVIQPQFEPSERIYAQHQPPSIIYDPTPSDSQLKAKFESAKPEQGNNNEKAEKEITASHKKYSDVVKKVEKHGETTKKK